MAEHTFYDKNTLSIVLMRFYYPGKGKSSDWSLRPECAPKWHPLLLKQDTSNVILLVSKYAQECYLTDKRTLTERIKNCRAYPSHSLPLPHPSPKIIFG